MSTTIAVASRTKRPSTRSLPVQLSTTPTSPARQPALIVTRSLLKEALAEVGRALPGKPALPILGHVLLVAEHNSLSLTVTDLSVCATRWIEAESPEPWSVTAPGKLFTDVVNALPEGPLAITYLGEQQAIHMLAGRFETTIKGISADDFPHIPHVAGPQVTLHGALLADAIHAVAFAAATDNVRPVLEGVHLSINGTTATLSAADGLRLAQSRIDLIEPAQAADVIVPATALADLARMFARSEHVTLTIGETQMALRAEGRQALLRIIDGRYPDITRVIPNDYRARLVAQTSALTQAIRLIKLFASESANIVRLLPSDGLLTLRATAAELGDQSAAVPITIEGETVTTALNARFLADALETIATEQVAIELVADTRPIVIRPVGDDSLLQLIMPMTVR